MKKESTFKMKGFSGFGAEESPAKKKTVTINPDGGKTVTRTRRDGTVRKVKEFKPGKKKAFKTTKTFKDGYTKTREFKKGVAGPTVTYTNPKGRIYSQTTRKERRKAIGRDLREGGKVLAGVTLATMGAAALPGVAAGGLKSLAGAGAVSYASDVIGGIGRGAKRIISKIKKNRKNPNRKRL